jgi:hypothetical protein
VQARHSSRYHATGIAPASNCWRSSDTGKLSSFPNRSIAKKAQLQDATDSLKGVIDFMEKTGKTAALIDKPNLKLADLRVKDTEAKEEMNSAKS